MTTPPNGWYPDPADSTKLRYWDGSAWTHNVQDAPTPQAAPQHNPYQNPAGQAAPYGQQGSGPSQPAAGTDAYGQPVAGDGQQGGTYPGAGQSDPGATQPLSQPAPYQGNFGQSGSAPTNPYQPDPYQPNPYAPQPGQAAHNPYAQGAQPTPYGQPGGYAYGGAGSEKLMLPDGTPTAGWGARLVAYIMDGFLQFLLTVAFGFVWLRNVFAAFSDYFSQVMDAAEQGLEAPTQATLMESIQGDLVILTIVSLLVSFLYGGLFLTRFGATPGKMMMGLAVRSRDTPGPLTWMTYVKRWTLQYGYQVLGAIPIIGSMLGLYGLLDGLWPLWDSRRQAIHDKWADTQVIRTR